MKLAFKIDVDTYDGTRVGVDNLRRLFSAFGINATFLFSLGEDQMGRSITRVFQKGFIRKCLKSNVAGNYSARTMMYGTILPAPVIGRRCAAQIRAVAAEGFECGVHSWNHYRWQNKLFKMPPERVEAEFLRACGAFEEITGRRCECCGCAGWQVVPAYLEAEDKLGILYASDARGTSPFAAVMRGRKFGTIQIPTTLYTLDEITCENKIDDAAQIYLKAIKGAERSVMTIHAELEGMAFLDWFKNFLGMLKAEGAEFYNLRDYASSLAQKRAELPVCEIKMSPFPSRGGLIAVQQDISNA